MFSGHSSALVPDMQKIWTVTVATSMLSDSWESQGQDALYPHKEASVFSGL